MMRRIAKPFTVEVKKRGARKREGGDALVMREEAPSSMPVGDIGRTMRFRDAETLFRNLQPAAEDAEEPSTPEPFPTRDDIKVPAERRILPDLVAEAAISEQTALALTPEPRRRGRPPKARTDDVVPRKRGRPPKQTIEIKTFVDDLPEITPPAASPVLHVLASERRRAARATDSLPRGERWKRRLPRVCW